MRGTTAPTLLGELPVPRRPPSEPLHRAALRRFAAKRLQRFGVAITTKGAFALLWTPSSKGHFVAPCIPRPRAIAPLGSTTGVSTPASTKREMSALPLGTHRPAPRISWAASGVSGERARSGGQPSAYRKEHGPKEARSTRFLSSARRAAGGVRCARPQLRSVRQCFHQCCRLRSARAAHTARDTARSTDARDAAIAGCPDQHAPGGRADRQSLDTSGSSAMPG